MASLSTLQPWLQPWANWIFRYGQTLDGKLVITSARRSTADQIRLYNRYIHGESEIPAAVPGKSRHEYGEAFDMAQLGVDVFESRLLPWLGRWWVHYGGLYGGARDPVHFGVRR